MSQTFFSKLDEHEKKTRLSQLANVKGQLTIWSKGQSEKHTLDSIKFDHERLELVLDSKDDFYPDGSSILCSFVFRGMTFFAKASYKKSAGDYCVIHFNGEFYKAEKRSSYRLMTYPIYQVYALFDTTEYQEEVNVIEMKKSGQTGLFKNFIKLVESQDGKELDEPGLLKVRVQDLSTTGLALHVSDIEHSFFVKDRVFKNVYLVFTDERILIPRVKVVYVVDMISNEKGSKKYKIGLHFPELSPKLDDQLGKKINKLLREVDANKDFENLIK